MPYFVVKDQAGHLAVELLIPGCRASMRPGVAKLCASVT